MAVQSSESFDPKRALRIVTLTDDHGRSMEIQVGILPSSKQYHPDPDAFIASEIQTFAADEEAIASFMQANPTMAAAKQ